MSISNAPGVSLRAFLYGAKLAVTSSNVMALQYDSVRLTMYVWFKPGKDGRESLYSYQGVEPDKATRGFHAPSKGKWIWAELRDKHPYQRE